MAFRSTMKDLSLFADIDTLMDPQKCPTAVSQATEKYNQDIFSLKTRTILSESTAISPAIRTIQEKPTEEAHNTPLKIFPVGKKVENYNRIKSFRRKKSNTATSVK